MKNYYFVAEKIENTLFNHHTGEHDFQIEVLDTIRMAFESSEDAARFLEKTVEDDRELAGKLIILRIKEDVDANGNTVDSVTIPRENGKYGTKLDAFTLSSIIYTAEKNEKTGRWEFKQKNP